MSSPTKSGSLEALPMSDVMIIAMDTFECAGQGFSRIEQFFHLPVIFLFTGF